MFGQILDKVNYRYGEKNPAAGPGFACVAAISGLRHQVSGWVRSGAPLDEES
jgi:hypothetical protein